jgi:hypothetical protein
MAKGKSSTGSKTSKGERISSMSTSVKDPAQKILNQINALQKGKNVVWSLPVVGKNGKVMPNKIIKVNGKDYINSLKHNQKGMKEVEA